MEWTAWVTTAEKKRPTHHDGAVVDRCTVTTARNNTGTEPNESTTLESQKNGSDAEGAPRQRPSAPPQATSGGGSKTSNNSSESGVLKKGEQPDGAPTMPLWRKILREPLLHFAIVATLLLALRPGPEPPPIVVDEALVTSLRALQPGTQDEVLIEGFIRDELLYREARALSLEENDALVRRRLIQKMEAILMAREADPSEAALRQFFDANAAAFGTPARVSIRHLFFSKDRREAPTQDARAILDELQNDALAELSPQPGDAFVAGARFPRQRQSDLDGRFGPGFAQQVFGLEVGRWQGPVESSFGAHLVFVESQHGATETFESVRSAVEARWREETRVRQLEEAIAELRARTRIERQP